jgi:predicted nucleotidyltransferase
MRELTQALLDELTRRLVAEFDPEQIILFGSHAWGVPNEDSDVDCVVIVADSQQAPHQRAARAQRALGRLLVPVDVFVKTRDEFLRFAAVSASLEHQILTRGKIVYGPTLSSSSTANPDPPAAA